MGKHKSGTGHRHHPGDLEDGLHGLREAFEGEAEAYSDGADRPLGGYVRVLATYGAVVGGMALVLRRRTLPERLDPHDLALVALATHQLSRQLTKDPVTSPIRAPFTRYEGLSGPSELHEEVRGRGVKHSIGELVTCPFCLSQWIGTGFVFGLVTAPRVTRLVASLYSALAVSDLLQFARAKAIQATG
jgi:hypothetical protein